VPSLSKSNCKVVCEDNFITVDTNSEQIHFNKSMPHGDGKIMATEFFTHTECVPLVLQKTTYADLHCRLGHLHKQAVIETAKHYGMKN
jgi:hypothetical protein